MYASDPVGWRQPTVLKPHPVIIPVQCVLGKVLVFCEDAEVEADSWLDVVEAEALRDSSATFADMAVSWGDVGAVPDPCLDAVDVERLSDLCASNSRDSVTCLSSMMGVF